jgi:teichuronic acid biosynthesis glycosyltransferase TuaG
VATVSIITPAWNAAAYIGETIASVRAQTFEDWQWLIVDDGSTDDTADVILAHAATDPRITLLQQPNAGPSAARNHAMRNATGRWFAFLDSDDVWQPRFLEAQLGVFRAHADTDLVTATAINRGGPFDGHPTRLFVTGRPVLTREEMILDETSVFIMTVFRREIFETIGGFDESQWTSEDYDFWLRAAQAGFVFRKNPEPLAWYRVRGESLSRQRARMLAGLVTSYRKARMRSRIGSREFYAINRQLTRFESELLLEEAKVALERQQFAVAAERLELLRARGGGLLVGVTAWLARHLPAAATLAYRLRGWRPRMLATLRSHSLSRSPKGGPTFASQS